MRFSSFSTFSFFFFLLCFSSFFNFKRIFFLCNTEMKDVENIQEKFSFKYYVFCCCCCGNWTIEMLLLCCDMIEIVEFFVYMRYVLVFHFNCSLQYKYIQFKCNQYFVMFKEMKIKIEKEFSFFFFFMIFILKTGYNIWIDVWLVE